mgnify:CR=1 FL=1
MRDAWLGILRFGSAGLRETWTNGARTGAAIWIPPGRAASSLVDSLRLLPAFARLTGWRRVREAAAAVELLDRRRRLHAPGPHFYLAALGVEPELQRQGIGSALLEPALRAADERGMAAYLETATAMLTAAIDATAARSNLSIGPSGTPCRVRGVLITSNVRMLLMIVVGSYWP